MKAENVYNQLSKLEEVIQEVEANLASMKEAIEEMALSESVKTKERYVGAKAKRFLVYIKGEPLQIVNLLYFTDANGYGIDEVRQINELNILENIELVFGEELITRVWDEE